nr:MAG TPA: hypothetical protein [Bacteriophage sp.]
MLLHRSVGARTPHDMATCFSRTRKVSQRRYIMGAMRGQSPFASRHYL